MSIKKKLAVLISIAAFAATSLSPVYAGGAAGPARFSSTVHKKLREGTNVIAPFAFIRYCVSSPEACQTSGNGELEWSAKNQALVLAVNQRVNRSIRPVNDSRELWQADVSSGDCEDYALTKRAALLRSGLPASALRMSVAITAKGEGHAVLVVKTSSGDFVLDNRHSRLLPWYDTDLTFLKIASAEDPRLWRRLL